MKKILGLTLLFLLVAGMTIGTALAANNPGPAPNSGDCIPDGSGFEAPNTQNPDTPGMGPAPNSGDCIPDGSGF